MRKTDRLGKIDLRSLNQDQFAEVGLSPTEFDGFATVVHLTDSAAFNFKHGFLHLGRTMQEAQKIQDHETRTNVLWNAAHSEKHMIKARNDLDNLRNHLKQHPLFKDHVAELRRNEQGPGTG